jgi:hypothetical protein
VAQSEENPFYDNPLRVTLGIQLVIHFDKRASFDDRHLWKNFRVVLTPPRQRRHTHRLRFGQCSGQLEQPQGTFIR